MPAGAPSLGNSAGIKDIIAGTVTVSPGLVTLAGKTVTAAFTGVRPGDKIDLLEVVGGLTLGTIITGARVSANDTIEFRFSTAIAVGVTLGSTQINFLWFKF